MSDAPRSSLALSQPLLRWLREDPAWTALSLPQRARLAWQAHWGSTNSRLGQALAAQREPMTLDDPLLIAGPWRSGTTVMHELLAAALGSTTPLTWQCMNACAFELTPRRSGGRSIARPMDGLEISDDSPQEDEFALLALGVDSAYRAFWMPHRIGELQHTLDPQYWLARPQWLTTWEAFLRGLLRTASQPRQPLILKSPNHTYRLPSILQRFPRTRIVWMARPAGEVFQSNRLMWQMMFDRHGLGPADTDRTDRFIAAALDAAAQALRWCMQTMDRRQWTVIAHDALVADPGAAVDAVMQHLRLNAPTRGASFDLTLARLQSGRIQQHDLRTLPPVAVSPCRQLDAAQADALAQATSALLPNQQSS